MLTKRLLIVMGLGVATTGCATKTSVGGNPDDGMNGTADTGDDDANDDADDGMNGTAGSDDDDLSPICPANPSSCAIACEDGSCSGPLSEFDDDGCLRPRCDQNPCADDRTCVDLGVWGSCVASVTACEQDDTGTCSCGGTADCMPASVCVPNDESPPPIEVCIAPDPGAGFSFEPPIFEDQGAATCTVTSIEPIQFDCAGDFNGMYTLDLYTSGQVDLTQDEEVTLDYWFQAEDEWGNEWLRVTRDGAPSAIIVAVSADSLLPPGVSDENFWPEDITIGTADAGCPVALCPDVGGQITGRAIQTQTSVASSEFAAGEGGMVPRESPGEVVIQVRETRQGACGANLADQQAWNAFTLVQQG